MTNEHQTDELYEYLENSLPPERKRHRDILRDYRMWLDENDIPAETDDGWPSERAINKDTVEQYLAEVLG